jgi:hypothetical protein
MFTEFKFNSRSYFSFLFHKQSAKRLRRLWSRRSNALLIQSRRV